MSFACPVCGAATRVIATRLTRSDTLRRRHECLGTPTHRFTSVQTVVPDRARVSEKPEELLAEVPP